MGGVLLVEADILKETAQINLMIVAFIEVRADNFWKLEKDGSRRRW